MASSARRPHRKSRNGCVQCKERHIRCDERRPACVNCEGAQRTCKFLSSDMFDVAANITRRRRHTTAAKTRPPSRDGLVEVEAAIASGIAALRQQSKRTLARPSQFMSVMAARDAGIISKCSPSLLHESLSVSCLPGFSEGCIGPTLMTSHYTIQHMVLLRYAEMVPNVVTVDYSMVDIAIHYAVDAPYLLDEILAYIASHMATVFPESAAQLTRLSTELQSRAIDSFNQAQDLQIEGASARTFVPRFLFSSVLGRHVLTDTLNRQHSDFDSFIERLIESLHLNRGIRVIAPELRKSLDEPELRPFLIPMIEATRKLSDEGDECKPLTDLLDESDLDDASIQSCRRTVQLLQRSFDLYRVLAEEHQSQAVSTFSVWVEAEFIEVLRQQRPEALIILAFYGVLSHRCRRVSALVSAGAFTIQAVSRQLDSVWQKWLAWPLEVMEGYCHG